MLLKLTKEDVRKAESVPAYVFHFEPHANHVSIGVGTIGSRCLTVKFFSQVIYPKVRGSLHLRPGANPVAIGCCETFDRRKKYPNAKKAKRLLVTAAVGQLPVCCWVLQGWNSY